MELEAARRAVLAAVRGTCAADLPRLLHWMRNTSKRGPARPGRRAPGAAAAVRQLAGPRGSGPERGGRPGACSSAPAGRAALGAAAWLPPFRYGAGAERADPHSPAGARGDPSPAESRASPARARPPACLTAGGLRRAGAAQGRSRRRAGSRLCRRLQADGARLGGYRPAAPRPRPSVAEPLGALPPGAAWQGRGAARARGRRGELAAQPGRVAGLRGAGQA